MPDGTVPVHGVNVATSVTPDEVNQKFVYSVYYPDEVGASGPYRGKAYFATGWVDRNAALDAARMIKGFVVQTPIIADFRVESGRLD